MIIKKDYVHYAVMILLFLALCFMLSEHEKEVNRCIDFYEEKLRENFTYEIPKQDEIIIPEFEFISNDYDKNNTS